jgi:hypothetical protein
MRIFKINDQLVDLDEKTAIGITFQAYDMKDPGKRKVNISNTFTIPATANNMAIIGFAGNVHSNDTTIYDVMYCDYYIDNEHIIKNSKVRIQEVSDRISLFVFQKDDIWEALKLYKWADFVPEFLTWLQTSKGYYSESSYFNGTFESFITTLSGHTTGLVLPMYFGNLYNAVYNKIGETKTFNYSESQTSFAFIAEFTYLITNWDSSGSSNVISVTESGGEITYPLLIEKGLSYSFDIEKETPDESAELSFFGFDVYIEDTTNICLKYYPIELSEPANGGHICAYVKTIVDFLESKYDINFCVNESGITANIWDDPYASAIYVPIRDIDIKFHYTGLAVTGYYYAITDGGKFLPGEDLQDKPEKTLYDLINAFMQHFNIIKDDIEIEGNPAIRLARFDDMKTLASVVKFSGKLSGTPKFKPYIDGYAIENYIKFDSIYPEGDPLINSRTIICDNKNLDATKELFTIDAYIPSFVDITGGVVPDLSTQESFKTFVFLISSGITTEAINVSISSDSEPIVASLQLPKAAIYSLASEYKFIDEIIQHPKYYEIEKWLTLKDIQSIEFFKQYYIQELNGSYFINKISGFNPDKSNSPTKLELLWISNQAVIDFLDLKYYTDGIGNTFTDGLGNKFF